MHDIINYENLIIEDIKNKKIDTLIELQNNKIYSICNISFKKIFFSHIDHTHWDFNFIVNYAQKTNIDNEEFWIELLQSSYFDVPRKIDIYNYFIEKKYLNVLNINSKKHEGTLYEFVKYFDSGFGEIINDKQFRDTNEKNFFYLLKNLIDTEGFIFNNMDFLSMLNKKRVGFMLFPYFLEKRFSKMKGEEQDLIISSLFYILNIYNTNPLYFPFTTLFDKKEVKTEEYKNKITNFILKNRKNKNDSITLHNEEAFFRSTEIWNFIFKKIKKHTPNFTQATINNLLNISINHYNKDLFDFYINNNGFVFHHDKYKNAVFLALIQKSKHDLFTEINGQFDFLHKLSKEKSLDFFYHIINKCTSDEKYKNGELFEQEWKKEILLGHHNYKNCSDELLTMIGFIESLYIKNKIKDYPPEDLKYNKKRI